MAGFGTVVEIDPACLTGYDFSPLRLVVAVHSRLDIPSELWVNADDGNLGGSIAQILPIRVWPRHLELNQLGGLIPFFGPPPPNPFIPPNHPAGPLFLGPDVAPDLPPPHTP